MSWMKWVPIVLGVVSLACSGEVVTVIDSSPPDLPTTPDASADRGAEAAAPDTTPAHDAHPLGKCALWSGWTCKTDPTFLCKAECTTGGKKYMLNCTTTGHCVCGIARSPCGPFTSTSPCDACKKAVEFPCCSPL